MTDRTTAVIGLGNDYRTDDGVGLHVARQIDTLSLDGVRAVAGIGDGYALMNEWEGADQVFVIDCASSGAPPGTMFRFNALRETIPADMFSGLSTHSIAVNQVIDLAAVLNRLPRKFVVYGIEGNDFTYGTELTPAVLESAGRTVNYILKEIEAVNEPIRQ